MKKEDLKYYSLSITIGYYRGINGDKPYKMDDFELPLEIGQEKNTNYGEISIKKYVETEDKDIIGIIVSTGNKEQLVTFKFGIMVSSISEDMKNYKKCLLTLKTNSLFYNEVKNNYDKVKHLIKKETTL